MAFATRFRIAAVLKYSSNWRAKTALVFFIFLEGHGTPCGEADKFFKHNLTKSYYVKTKSRHRIRLL